MFDLFAVLEEKTTLLTASDVAEVFNIKQRTLKRLVADRAIPSFLVGGHLRFDSAQLLRWVKKRNFPALDRRSRMPSS